VVECVVTGCVVVVVVGDDVGICVGVVIVVDKGCCMRADVEVATVCAGMHADVIIRCIVDGVGVVVVVVACVAVV